MARVSKAEKERQARVRKIRRQHTEVTRYGYGRHQARLVIDQQSFNIGPKVSRDLARFMTTMLAIALERFRSKP